MPSAPLQPCAAPGCSELVEAGRCAAHARESEQRRGSAASRGYDRGWQEFRRWFIRRHPLCADCHADGIVAETEHVHHVKKLRDFPELRLFESNCLGLCASHHDKRTARGE